MGKYSPAIRTNLLTHQFFRMAILQTGRKTGNIANRNNSRKGLKFDELEKISVGWKC